MARSRPKEKTRLVFKMLCCGTGFVGSVCFWASQIRFRIRYSQVRIRLRILPSSNKNSKKNLDFYCFVTSL